MKKILIIDDEPLARLLVKEYLQGREGVEVVGECDNGFEAIKSVMKLKPDLLVLDVQMPKISGFEMLEVLEDRPDVIFATAFDEYAIKAFEQNAVDYLLKPFSKERFDAAIDKWLKQKVQQSPEEKKVNDVTAFPTAGAPSNNRIVVRNNNEITIVPVADVVYIEAFDDYVKIFTKDNFFLKKKTMNYYEESLDPTMFFRTHRSFIINLQQLSRIEPMEKNSYIVLLKGGKKVPLSRSSYIKLKEKLGI
jgi:two-component system LytT family response regulator